MCSCSFPLAAERHSVKLKARGESHSSETAYTCLRVRVPGSQGQGQPSGW